MATGPTGATPLFSFLNPFTSTSVTVPVGTIEQATFTGINASNGTDITFSAPSDTITLAAGHSYLVTYTARGTLPVGATMGTALTFNGTTIDGTFTQTSNTGTVVGNNFSTSGSAIVTGPGTIQLNLASSGSTIDVLNTSVTVTELN